MSEDKRSYYDYVKTLPILEDGQYRLASGMVITVMNHPSWDHIIVAGMDKDGFRNASVHVVSPDPETGADTTVMFYDNLNIRMFGTAKRRPKFVLLGDEFPIDMNISYMHRESTLSSPPSKDLYTG